MKEPKRSNRLNDAWAIFLGIFLLIEGIWGLFSNEVFSIFGTNKLHAVIHIVLGALGIILGIRQNAGGYCTFLGLLLILVGLFWFIPGMDIIVINLLNVNRPVGYVNIIAGLISLIVVYYRRPGELKN